MKGVWEIQKPMWDVPEKCPLKSIIDSIGGTLRRPFSCNTCLMNCSLCNRKREVVLVWRPRKWVINFSQEFTEYIMLLRATKTIPRNTTAIKGNPMKSLTKTKTLDDVSIKGVYTQVKNSIEYYFDLDWDSPMYDFIASVVMTSYSDVKPLLKEIS